MRSKRYLILLGVYFIFQLSFIYGFSQPSQLQTDLDKFPEIVSVQKIENHPFFQETYEIMIEQYLDHKNPAAGKFNQRIILSNYNKFSPVIFVTEGYDANYATKNTYINELSKIVEANQLVVEHRYFGKSTPNELNWDFLTIENACADLHRIQRIFQRLYSKNKWIATGISKGGQQTIAYKAFYPNDMDIWIPYVAPINYGIEDGRHEKFFKTVGTEKCRKSIIDFQKKVLTNRAAIMPLLDSLVAANSYTFNIPTEEVLDFCVLEFQFAFWQWGKDCASIPSDSASMRELFNYLVTICEPEYFSKEGTAPILSFFVQAAKEFGYYGYDPGELLPLMKIKSSENYLDRIFLPQNFTYSFDKSTSKFINKAIQKDGSHMIFIYGEYDPWTASSISLKPKNQALKIVQPKGSHKARINNLSYSQQAQIYIQLEKWLEED